MVLSISGKITGVEHDGKWWSFNLPVDGGLIKIIVESVAPLTYKVGDQITTVAKYSRLEKGALKMFSTPGLISLVDDE